MLPGWNSSVYMLVSSFLPTLAQGTTERPRCTRRGSSKSKAAMQKAAILHLLGKSDIREGGRALPLLPRTEREKGKPRGAAGKSKRAGMQLPQGKVLPQGAESNQSETTPRLLKKSSAVEKAEDTCITLFLWSKSSIYFDLCRS